MRNAVAYAKFLRRVNGDVAPALATDSEFQLDGRNRIPVWRVDCVNELRRRQQIHPHYCGFKIFWKGRCVFEWVEDVSETQRRMFVGQVST